MYCSIPTEFATDCDETECEWINWIIRENNRFYVKLNRKLIYLFNSNQNKFSLYIGNCGVFLFTKYHFGNVYVSAVILNGGNPR